MAQNVEHSKLERLHKSIDDLDVKIKALISKKEELQAELKQAQQNEIISIVTNLYKTPLELSEFIKQALPKQNSSGTFGIIIIVLFGVGVATYFYFFKFKKKEVVPQNNDDYLEDNYGYDEEEDEENEEETGDSSEKEEAEDEDDFGEKSEQEVFLDKPKIEAEKFDKNATSESKVVEDEIAFTDEDIGENHIGDDYREEINTEEVLGVGVIGGEFDDDEEDNTV